jgi:hypothetical protein
MIGAPIHVPGNATRERGRVKPRERSSTRHHRLFGGRYSRDAKGRIINRASPRSQRKASQILTTL